MSPDVFGEVEDADVCTDMKPVDPNWEGLCFAGKTEVIYEAQGKLGIAPFIEVRRNKESKGLLGNERIKMDFVKLPKIQMVKLFLKNGEELICTEDHLFPTRKGLIQAKNLEGQELKVNTTPIETSDLGNYSLGYFLGIFLSEGSLTNLQCRVANQNLEILHKASQLPKSLGLDYRIIEDKYGQRSLEIKSKAIKVLLEHFIGGNSARSKFMKVLCYNLSLETRKALLEGIYDGDGRKDRKAIGVSSERLARNIVGLCVTLGLPTSFRKYSYGNNVEYRISFGKQNRCFKWYAGECFVKVLKVERYVGHNKFVYCFRGPKGDSLFTLGNGIITHNCFDHHPGHPEEKDRKYRLVWGDEPASKIVYDKFKEFIPENQHWKMAIGVAGDGRADIVPVELWHRFPILLSRVSSVYERYGNIKLYPLPLYLKVVSGINACCKIPGKWYTAYSIFRSAQDPFDILYDDAVNLARTLVATERKRCTSEYPIVDLNDLIRIWPIESEYKIERGLAWRAEQVDHKTAIVLNQKTGSLSIRGVLATLIYGTLEKEGYRVGGHPGFGGGFLKETQDIKTLIRDLKKIKV